MGGSYGGYLTAWVIAHDHRFAGAIVERGFLDPVSFQGTSDIGTFFGDEYVGISTRMRSRVRARWPSSARHDADPRHPFRAGLPLPARAGDALLQRAQAAGDGCRDARLPRREPRADRGRASLVTAWSGSPPCSTGGQRKLPVA